MLSCRRGDIRLLLASEDAVESVDSRRFLRVDRSLRMPWMRGMTFTTGCLDGRLQSNRAPEANECHLRVE